MGLPEHLVPEVELVLDCSPEAVEVVVVREGLLVPLKLLPLTE